MDTIARIYLIFTACVALCQCLPEDTKPLPDPSVFEMKPTEDLRKLFPFMGENLMFPKWPQQKVKEGQKIKFPDWFYLPDFNPKINTPLDKKTEKTESEGTPGNNIGWALEEHEDIFYDTSPNEEQLNAKDVFPAYYNVFGSNAYPSWMVMPGSLFGSSSEKKDQNDIQVKEKSAIKPEPETKPAPVNTLKLSDEEKVTSINEDASKMSNPPLPHDSKDSKEVADSSAIIFPIVGAGVKEELKDDKSKLDKVNSLVSKSEREVSDKSKASSENPITVPASDMVGNGKPVQDSPFNQAQVILFTNLPYSQVPIDPHKSENNEESIAPSSSVANFDNKAFASMGDNRMPHNFLYNLLQKINLSDLPSMFTHESPSTTQKAALLTPLEDVSSEPSPQLPQSKSIVSGNNVVINNADNLPSVDQHINKPNALNQPNNGALPNLLQNLRPENTMPRPVPLTNQGNMPNNAINQPNPRPGIATSNNNIHGNPGSPVYQNNNYPQYPGRPVYYNNVPYGNAVPVNNGEYGQQGNLILFNSQPLQTNLGQGNGYGLNSNNMALVSPGGNSGQNIYAILPVSSGNGGANANTGPRPYVNNNLPVNSNGYQMLSSIPVYNLIPVNKANVLTNTKDEVDE